MIVYKNNYFLPIKILNLLTLNNLVIQKYIKEKAKVPIVKNNKFEMVESNPFISFKIMLQSKLVTVHAIEIRIIFFNKKVLYK